MSMVANDEFVHSVTKVSGDRVLAVVSALARSVRAANAIVDI
jgi:hypothetical protein